MRVRITKCDEPLAWYANKIGETFEVFVDSLYDHTCYVLQEDFFELGGDGWRIIELDDCVEDAHTRGVKECS